MIIPTIPTDIIEIRQSLGYGSVEFARLLGYQYTTFNKYTSGSRKITRNLRHALVMIQRLSKNERQYLLSLDDTA